MYLWLLLSCWQYNFLPLIPLTNSHRLFQVKFWRWISGWKINNFMKFYLSVGSCFLKFILVSQCYFIIEIKILPSKWHQTCYPALILSGGIPGFERPYNLVILLPSTYCYVIVVNMPSTTTKMQTLLLLYLLIVIQWIKMVSVTFEVTYSSC